MTKSPRRLLCDELQMHKVQLETLNGAATYRGNTDWERTNHKPSWAMRRVGFCTTDWDHTMQGWIDTWVALGCMRTDSFQDADEARIRELGMAGFLPSPVMFTVTEAHLMVSAMANSREFPCVDCHQREEGVGNNPVLYTWTINDLHVYSLMCDWCVRDDIVNGRSMKGLEDARDFVIA